MVDFFAHNHSNASIHLRTARLIKPRVGHQARLPGLLTLNDPLGGPYHSANHPILARQDSQGRLVVLVRQKIGQPGKMLNAVFGITDNLGFEYRLRVKLFPMPAPAPAAGASEPPPARA
jgi:hypothetical protein